MDQPQRTIMARTFPSVRDAEPLNERGHQLGCAKRQRLMPPLRFGLSVIASLATQQGPSIAAFPRDFHAWWDAESSDKAFSTQVATARGAAVFRPSLGDLMGQLPMQGLRFAAGQALSACHRLGMQDGSACARHDALAQGFPGRFSAVKPAAVARHGTLDWLHEAPLTMVVRPETAAEHAALPAPERLRGERVLADRGYLELAWLRAMDRHGGFFRVRGTAGRTPRVIDAYRADGQRLTSCQDRDVQAIVSNCPTRHRAALAVEWRIEPQPFRPRLMVRGHPETQSFASL